MQECKYHKATTDHHVGRGRGRPFDDNLAVGVGKAVAAGPRFTEQAAGLVIEILLLFAGTQLGNDLAGLPVAAVWGPTLGRTCHLVPRCVPKP